MTNNFTHLIQLTDGKICIYIEGHGVGEYKDSFWVIDYCPWCGKEIEYDPKSL